MESKLIHLLDKYLSQQVTHNRISSHIYPHYSYVAHNCKSSLITYSDVIAVENLKAGLSMTKSGVAPGLDGQLKANFTDKKVQNLHTSLKTQKYKPKANKRVLIPKPDGGQRPLGIASQTDKVVQGAIKVLLEPVLERDFHENSFGFRQNLGCHDALKYMKYNWQNCTWIVNVDIAKCFDKINHDRLLKLLEDYCDQALVELIRKLLKVGYVDIHNLADRSEYGVEGTPQGSLISPLLCNLFLNDLDRFLSFLSQELTRGSSRAINADWLQRAKLTEDDKVLLSKYPELRGQLKKVKHRRRVLEMKPSKDTDDPGFRRFHHVRYADDFIVGFVGPKEEALAIMSLICLYLEHIKLGANDKKSKVFHAGDRGIKYLGMYLRYIKRNKITSKPSDITLGQSQVSDLVNKSVNSMQLRAPVELILKRAVDRGYAKFRSDNSVRATSCRKLGSLSDADIVRRFSAIIRGILNYYSCVNSKSDLWAVVSLYRKSCALTLADKHSLKTAAKAFRKFGPRLKVQPEKPGGKVTELYYPDSLKTSISFKTGKACIQAPAAYVELDKLRGSHKSLDKTSEVCQYEGCEKSSNLEEHHINPMANASRKDLTSFEVSLIRKKRKTVTLCRKHHLRVENRKLLIKASNESL
jgi:group II intron reverse transcriptase/maturase